MKNKITIALIIIGALLTGIYYFSYQKNKFTNKNINPRAYGPLCGEIVGACNNLVAINCKAEVDGPFYYVDVRSGEVVGRCGGECIPGGCPTLCPPKEWTCK